MKSNISMVVIEMPVLLLKTIIKAESVKVRKVKSKWLAVKKRIIR